MKPIAFASTLLLLLLSSACRNEMQPGEVQAKDGHAIYTKMQDKALQDTITSQFEKYLRARNYYLKGRDTIPASILDNGGPEPRVMDDLHVYLDDMNCDGMKDALLIYELRPVTKSDGYFYRTAVYLNRGDSMQLFSDSIAQAVKLTASPCEYRYIGTESCRVHMRVSTYGAQDPPCCPSEYIPFSFKLDEKRHTVMDVRRD